MSALLPIGGTIALALAVYVGGYGLLGPPAAGLALLAGAFALLLVVLQRRDSPLVRPWFPALRALLLGGAMFAFAAPFLLNWWIRGDDYERYFWIIRLSGPCQYLGSGPLMLWTAISSWLGALSLLSLILATRDRAAALPREGLLLGIALVGALALSMTIEPRVFAWLLGCFGGPMRTLAGG